MSAPQIMTLGARALKALHRLDHPPSALPPRPLSVTLPLALQHLNDGLTQAADFEPRNRGRAPLSLYNDLKKNIPAHPEDLVFCHGDFSFGNIIYSPESDNFALIDWGRCGVADRYQDLALFFRDFEECFALDSAVTDLFLREYGLVSSIDTEKVRFYQDLDEFF
jgi:aminoglycoside phosphotransferase